MLVGLTQQYLKSRLGLTLGSPRGIVLEVREEVGLGHTANVILLDGVLKVGDSIVVAKREGAFITKVRAIFLPKPLDEMRDPRDKFLSVNEVVAAAGVKLSTPDLEGVLAGSPFVGLRGYDRPEDALRQVEGEVSSVFVKADRLGVVVKCDTIGSLEAMLEMLRSRSVPIRLGDIGAVTRRDVIEAATVGEKDPFLGVILAFGVKLLPDAQEEASSKNVTVFSDPVLYNLIQRYLEWVSTKKDELERKEFQSLVEPSKFKVLKGFVFRRSDPAIFGIEVIAGRLKPKATVMNTDGKVVGTIHQIQDRGKSIEVAEKGSQVAVSMTEPTIGRHIHEGDVLYTLPSDRDVKLLLTKYSSRLSDDGLQTLKELVEIRRKEAPLYGF